MKVIIHCTDTKNVSEFDSCLTERFVLEYKQQFIPRIHRKDNITHMEVPRLRVIDVGNIHERIYVVEESPGIHNELNKKSKLVEFVKKREKWSTYFTDT